MGLNHEQAVARRNKKEGRKLRKEARHNREEWENKRIREQEDRE